MRVVVVDTNVILVANNAHPEASPECVMACVNRLNDLMKFGVLVLDDGYRILKEYQSGAAGHAHGRRKASVG